MLDDNETLVKSRVITLDIPESHAIADRCIESGKKFGIEIEKFDAVQPKDLDSWINIKKFEDQYSFGSKAAACFNSHYKLWQQCVEDNVPYLILEHDAVFYEDPKAIMSWIQAPVHAVLVSIGKPSYGKFKELPVDEAMDPFNDWKQIHPLTSKSHLPGAHAYLVNPEAAKILIEAAKDKMKPTDLYLCNDNFDFLREYGWCVEVQDTFTTVQKKKGCLAKHAYNSQGNSYRIIR